MSLDLDAGWRILTEHEGGDVFRDSTACRAVFDRLPEILDHLANWIAVDEHVADARLRIALDANSVDALREHGYRLAVPPCDSFPFALAVNGNDAQRDATLLHGSHKLTVGGVLSTWPQMLVWFAHR